MALHEFLRVRRARSLDHLCRTRALLTPKNAPLMMSRCFTWSNRSSTAMPITARGSPSTMTAICS